MKYVLLGTLSPTSLAKQDKRTTSARRKMSELGIKIESIYYLQGPLDFVDVVDAPDAETMLAFSVWYSQQGFGKVVSCPAFDERGMVKALRKGGMRGKGK
jgi:uncharacterized protein with GYD domain